MLDLEEQTGWMCGKAVQGILSLWSYCVKDRITLLARHSYLIISRVAGMQLCGMAVARQESCLSYLAEVAQILEGIERTLPAIYRIRSLSCSSQ